MDIEKINSFKDALNSGINLFVGAGFSTLAEDCNGSKLPTGSMLLTELQERFNKNLQIYLNLLQF